MILTRIMQEAAVLEDRMQDQAVLEVRMEDQAVLEVRALHTVDQVDLAAVQVGLDQVVGQTFELLIVVQGNPAELLHRESLSTAGLINMMDPST